MRRRFARQASPLAMCLKLSWPPLAVLSLVSLACTQEHRPGAPDAVDGGALPPSLEAFGYGLQVQLTPDWLVLKHAQSLAGKSRLLSEARRPSPAFAVSPKLAFAVEPCPAGAPAEVFRQVLNTLRTLDERPGIRVIRTGLLTRTLPEGIVGEIDLLYRIESQDKKAKIVHRSLAMPRPEQTGGLALVTLTATYLHADALRIGPEIDRIFTSFRVESSR